MCNKIQNECLVPFYPLVFQSFRLQSYLPLLFQNFKEHLVIEGTAEEACIAEVSCYNPSFPVTRLFTSVISELQRTSRD